MRPDREPANTLDMAAERRRRAAPIDEPDPRPPNYSDDALALRFADRHADDLRFVAAWGRWLTWTGDHWAFDDTLVVFDKARAICRGEAARCNQPKVAAVIASAKTIAAIERLARADRRIAATIDQWDADPMLLNTPSGVVDLRTGATRAHLPGDYMTKITAVGPGGSCPRFLQFLTEITNGDEELQAYLRRVFGYALTGVTREHALFFGYGTGRNGKSVLLNTMSAILGAFARTAPIETFTASSGDKHPTELAGLRGARLVTATETEEGRRWAESRIKSLTGGDMIAARFMRQDFFEYRPQFKLVIAGNHKPSLRSVDEAIRRRFHLIPFSVTVPAERVEPDLADRLKAEWPGILQWAIDGCLEWQTDGLCQPQAVRDATAAYMEAEDAIAAWIDDKCEIGAGFWEQSSSLFASWSEWATAAGEHVGTQKRFNQNLEARGLSADRKKFGRGFQGIRLADDASTWRRTP